MFIKYNDFKEGLNENVQQAKVFLKNRALKNKKAKLGETDEPVTLSADEVRDAERNPSFLKIKEMCERGIGAGYTYLFTKIFFDEMGGESEKFDELKEFHDEIKSLGNIVKDLPMPLDRYAAIKSTDEDGRGPFERLTDDLEQLKLQRKAKKFIDQLLPFQKEWVEKASKQQKDKLSEVATGFTEMGLDDDDKFDPALNKVLQRQFFQKIKDYKSLDAIIDAAINTIKSASNGSFAKFLKKIDDVTQKFGPLNGAEIIYNKDGLLAIEVNSYVANRELNAHTSHCIARYIGHWDNYLSDFNKQYYVYNFNLDPSNRESVIGMTMQPTGKISAAHLKDDANCLSTFKSIVEKWGIPFEIFKPMSPEEIEIKKKRIQATKTILMDTISVEQATQALEDGADPNAKGGKPLTNAVKANNIELVKLLLDRGAMPNMGDDESSRAISHTQSFDMLKLLVKYGASVTQSVFRNVKDDINAVKYLLEVGMDPGFEQSSTFRIAAKTGNVPLMKLILDYADNVKDVDGNINQKKEFLITARRFMSIKMAAENGQLESLKFIMEELKKLNTQDVQSPEALNSFVTEIMNWISTSHKVDATSKEKCLEFFKEYLKKNESYRFYKFENFKMLK